MSRAQRRKLTSGNYIPDRQAIIDEEPKGEKKEGFEEAATARLGGSIAFVRGRKLVEEAKEESTP